MNVSALAFPHSKISVDPAGVNDVEGYSGAMFIT